MPTPRPFALLATALSPFAATAVPVTVQLLGPNGQPLAGAVVAVEVKGRPARTSTAKAEMGQRDRQFTPQLLVVQTGTAVSFPNFDTVRHHVYSFSPIKVIDIKLYSGTPAEPIVLGRTVLNPNGSRGRNPNPPQHAGRGGRPGGGGGGNRGGSRDGGRPNNGGGGGKPQAHAGHGGAKPAGSHTGHGGARTAPRPQGQPSSDGGAPRHTNGPRLTQPKR